MPLEELKRKMQAEKLKYGDRLPPGQKLVENWPVLSYGKTPQIDAGEWTFTVRGLVEEESVFTWDEFNALPQVTVVSDIHCVTRWSRFNNEWQGVTFNELLKHVRVKPEAGHVMVHSYGGYATNLSIEDLIREGVLFAHTHNSESLSADHGGPMRLVVPHLYFWKSAKWVRGIEFLSGERPGFWEMHGYHIRGNPWAEERYDEIDRGMRISDPF